MLPEPHRYVERSQNARRAAYAARPRQTLEAATTPAKRGRRAQRGPPICATRLRIARGASCAAEAVEGPRAKCSRRAGWVEIANYAQRMRSVRLPSPNAEVFATVALELGLAVPPPTRVLPWKPRHLPTPPHRWMAPHRRMRRHPWMGLPEGDPGAQLARLASTDAIAIAIGTPTRIAIMGNAHRCAKLIVSPMPLNLGTQRRWSLGFE